MKVRFRVGPLPGKNGRALCRVLFRQRQISLDAELCARPANKHKAETNDDVPDLIHCHTLDPAAIHSMHNRSREQTGSLCAVFEVASRHQEA
jgi:hypothetical protein